MKLKLFFITILLTLILCSGIALNAQTTTAVSIDSAVLNGTKLSLTLHSDTETTAYIYAAEYNNGILSSLKLQNAVLTAYSSVISFDNISSDTEVFILDKNLSPLCESFYVSNITGDGINGAGEQPDTAPYENPYTASDHSGLFTDTAVAAKTGPTMPGGHGGGQGGPNPGVSEDVSYGYIKVDGGYIYINNTNVTVWIQTET